MISEATNLFLCSLSPTSRQYLMAVAKSVELPLKTKLYNPDTTPPYAYFLNSGLASVVTPMANGQTTEVGFIGYEGIVGSLHLLGDAPIPSQGVMQLTGKG
jgi:CRP-like cAMP-binding protein